MSNHTPGDVFHSFCNEHDRTMIYQWEDTFGNTHQIYVAPGLGGANNYVKEGSEKWIIPDWIEADENPLAEIDRLDKLSCDLLKALEGLCRKLEAIHDDQRYKHVWEIAHLHCGSYTGPNYVEELSEANQAIKKARGEK